MELPITVFWTLSNHIERISAQEDLRQFRAMANSHGGEGTQDYVNSLSETVGKVMVVDPILSAVRDEEGFAELKNMAAQLTG